MGRSGFGPQSEHLASEDAYVRDRPAGDRVARSISCLIFLVTSLNMLRVRQMLRPQESFHRSPLFPPTI